MTFLTASRCCFYIPKSIWPEKARTILCADSHLSGAWWMVKRLNQYRQTPTQQVSYNQPKPVFIARQYLEPSTKRCLDVLGIVEYEWTCLYYRSYISRFLCFLVCLAYIFGESFFANQKNAKEKKRQQKKHEWPHRWSDSQVELVDLRTVLRRLLSQLLGARRSEFVA